jgi:hypothetical protein
MLKLLAALSLALILGPALAQQMTSTVNPLVPASNSGLSSAIIRNNFAAAYNDLNTLFAKPPTTGTGGTQATITQRPGTLTFPVPTFRPSTANSVIALDLFPNGTPTPAGHALAWFDICDTDIKTGFEPLNCLHMGARDDSMEIGVQQYGTGSAVKALIFTNNNGTEYARLQPTGGFSFGTTNDPGAGAINLRPQTFASLKTCAAGVEGALASVTDSASATFNATMTGGGSNHVMAYCNGTNWTVH